MSAYTSWAAYGSSKTALNSLSQHIAVEEPDVTSVAISPGRADTNMQKEIREKGIAMSKEDYEGFKSAFEEGKLVRPEQSGRVIARLSVDAKAELSGKYFKYVSDLRAYARSLIVVGGMRLSWLNTASDLEEPRHLFVWESAMNTSNSKIKADENKAIS